MNFSNNTINKILNFKISIFLFDDKIIEYFRQMLYTKFNELIKRIPIIRFYVTARYKSVK